METNSTKTEDYHGGEATKKPAPYFDRRYSHSMSIDSMEGSYNPHEHYQKFIPGPLPPSPHGIHVHPMAYTHPYHISPHSRIPPHRPLQSVISTSFSIDDERENGTSPARAQHNEQRLENEESRQVTEDRDDWGSPSNGRQVYGSPRSFTSYHRSSVTGSFRDNSVPYPLARRGSTSPDGFQDHVYRSYSSGYPIPPPEALKRSYYHHSRPVTHYPGHTPPDFVPPKRSKVDTTMHEAYGSKKEVAVSPHGKEIKTHPRDYWTKRSFEPPYVHRSNSFPAPPGWGGKHFASPSLHSPGIAYRSRRPYIQASPATDREEAHRAWHSPTGSHWGSTSLDRYPVPRFWEPSREQESNRGWGSPPREHIGTRREDDESRRVSFAYHGTGAGSTLDPPGPNESKTVRTIEVSNAGKSDDSKSGILKDKHILDNKVMLLALPQDRVALSETLCIVRENVEVFTATVSDVNAPAPGRKHAVAVGQVGLRCIHCRHTTRSSDRVKRAVCYPSSIKRIYRTVIDMKLDHFTQCKYVPHALKNKLDELKAIHTRSTGTTMSYFCNAAKMLGMEDASNGVILRGDPSGIACTIAPVEKSKSSPTTTGRDSPQDMEVTRTESTSSSSLGSHEAERDAPPKRTDSMSSDSIGSTPQGQSITLSSDVTIDQVYEGLVPLALAEDKTALSPLRCFLREQVCAFSATDKDIAVRAPTTFSIAVGQVGIGCIHCVKKAATLRSNRAVCFPFSIGRIYQSVADIQRFHFGECKNMPDDIKDKFLDLQSASSKGSKGLATRQYWVTSAKKIGLADTTQGIRFCRDPTKPENSKSISLDMLAHVAFSVTTASKQLVLPEDKACIAEFLYVVMEQLQPCRFTEADRNKRRLKDVGCIGVECKHCAGQVDSRKFFWSSVSAVESNFVSVHTHMLECRMIPQELKDQLVELKRLRKEQTAALKTGSQKAFFARVWNRLHVDEESEDQTMNETNSAPSDVFLKSIGSDTKDEALLVLSSDPMQKQADASNDVSADMQIAGDNTLTDTDKEHNTTSSNMMEEQEPKYDNQTICQEIVSV